MASKVRSVGIGECQGRVWWALAIEVGMALDATGSVFTSRGPPSSAERGERDEKRMNSRHEARESWHDPSHPMA
jgi:hypothetical protein